MIRFNDMRISVPEPIPIPPEVRLFAKPLIAVGDLVKVGQLIGQACENGLPVHASVSGKVKSIDDFDPITGEKALSIIISSDGEQTLNDVLNPPAISDRMGFLDALKNSGAVGLGGVSDKLDYILINAVGCEPYVTSDAREAIDNADGILEGAVLLMKYMSPKQLIICVGDNNPEATQKLRTLMPTIEGISVQSLPCKYPQGHDKVLAHKVTGRMMDTGCAVVSSTAVSVLAKYIKTGMPYTHRVVTVEGSGVKTPKNLVVPLGTAIKHLFDFCGGLTDDATKIIVGGPMTGKAVPSLDMHLAKTHNAVLALNEKESEPALETACIKCSRCISGCPMNLMPSFITDAFEQKNIDMLSKLKVNQCTQCGCCAYVCPAKRPLTQVMSLTKDMLNN